jgi:23S rRNA (pseudouridine1915-N3)-methyltransferase
MGYFVRKLPPFDKPFRQKLKKTTTVEFIMKIVLIVVGKTKEAYLQAGEAEYLKRLGKFNKPEVVMVPDIKSAAGRNATQLAEKESQSIMSRIQPGDTVVLLDDKGQSYTSEAFADWLEHKQVHGTKRLIFVVGGAYGFSEALYQLADEKLSLSKMTFSHQMVRMIFLEQLYRAYTIVHHMPYHHA